MKTIVKLTDWYNENISCNVKVDAIKLDDWSEYRAGYYAHLTAGQIAKVRRELPNGCRAMNVISIDNHTGKEVDAEIYFDLD